MNSVILQACSNGTFLTEPTTEPIVVFTEPFSCGTGFHNRFTETV